MPLFACRKWEGVPQAREHGALKWVRPRDLAQLSDAARRPAARGDSARLALSRTLAER